MKPWQDFDLRTFAAAVINWINKRSAVIQAVTAIVGACTSIAAVVGLTIGFWFTNRSLQETFRQNRLQRLEMYQQMIQADDDARPRLTVNSVFRNGFRSLDIMNVGKGTATNTYILFPDLTVLTIGDIESKTTATASPSLKEFIPGSRWKLLYTSTHGSAFCQKGDVLQNGFVYLTAPTQVRTYNYLVRDIVPIEEPTETPSTCILLGGLGPPTNNVH